MFPHYFATGNANKLREVNEILGLSMEQISIDLSEPQAVNVAEVITKKAEDAYQKTGKVVLVEDTGVEFLAWNGLPGALMKWFLDSVGNEGILKMLQNETNRAAIAKTIFAFFDGNRIQYFQGEVKGTIATELHGKEGFGWDPIFIPEGFTKSFAEMSPSEKNIVSMRGLALENMKVALGM